MPRLMVSISGVRGVYGDGLDDMLAEKFACAFGMLYNGAVVVGRDPRTSGRALAQAIMRGLRKAGTDVIDIGLASTPTTEMAVPAQGASGGVIITASHNPGEWNGLKFLGPDGVFLDQDQGAELIAKYESLGDISDMEPRGAVSTWTGANDHHIQGILDLDYIDSDRIAQAGFIVCLDTVNGAGAPICADLLRRLGCEFHIINSEPTGMFTHNPEPVPAHIQDLCAFVKDKGADIGFAVDPDVDRLSIVSDEGVAIGEEYTLALLVDYIVGKTGCETAVNLSTSRMVDDSVERHGKKLHRSPIGEINVVKLMREVGARIGGEGNGGIILPELHPGRDAPLGIALMLQYLAESGKTISTLAGSIPSYCIIKEKAELKEKGAWIGPVKAAFDGATMDERDGVKVIYTDSWVHVRESNTEPIVRIMAEAPDRNVAESLIQKVRNIL